ncbi:hypothetical protein FOA52_008896 [Chlamydomonas sp. UWO 241]|nr:hypothetical protein FOA52_008896 [Chlamydomonas sp. UWO 241]
MAEAAADGGGVTVVDQSWSAARVSSNAPPLGSTATVQCGGGLVDRLKGFLLSGDFSDVVVVVAESVDHASCSSGSGAAAADSEPEAEWHLHAVILAAQSDFFFKALTAGFIEKSARHVRIECAGTTAAWPQLVEFFYTDALTISNDNVLPLLALARQLMVPAVDAACMDFIAQRLSPSTCLSYLREAVQYNLHELQRECVVLAAKGMFSLYASDVAGLPWQTLVEILQHEELTVNCEVQVVEFVLRYLAHTNVDAEGVAELTKLIRLPYLDNDTLAALADHGSLPREAVLEAALARVAIVDKPSLNLALLPTPPRPTYCCDLRYGLPGGCTHVDVDLESIWDMLVRVMTVRVSGVGDGHPLNVLLARLAPDDESGPWFETACSDSPPCWVEVQLPPNVVVTSLVRYTYVHGHRRTGYYRMRNFKTQVAETPGGTWVDVATRNFIEQNEVLITSPLSGGGTAPSLPTHTLPGSATAVGSGAHASRGGGLTSVGAAAAAAAAPVAALAPPQQPTAASAAAAAVAAVAQLVSSTGGATQPERASQQPAINRGFQVLRIVGTMAQEDGVHRLCIRDLKMFGSARVDLMCQTPGVDLVLAAGSFAPASSSTPGGHAPSGSGASGGGGGGASTSARAAGGYGYGGGGGARHGRGASRSPVLRSAAAALGVVGVGGGGAEVPGGQAPLYGGGGGEGGGGGGVRVLVGDGDDDNDGGVGEGEGGGLAAFAMAARGAGQQALPLPRPRQ